MMTFIMLYTCSSLAKLMVIIATMQSSPSGTWDGAWPKASATRDSSRGCGTTLHAESLLAIYHPPVLSHSCKIMIKWETAPAENES